VPGTIGESVMQELAELEYASKIHYISLSRFLNRRASIVLDTDPRKGAYFHTTKKEWRIGYGINEEKENILKVLEYFEFWEKEAKVKKIRNHSWQQCHGEICECRFLVFSGMRMMSCFMQKNTEVRFGTFLFCTQIKVLWRTSSLSYEQENVIDHISLQKGSLRLIYERQIFSRTTKCIPMSTLATGVKIRRMDQGKQLVHITLWLQL
jgi:hypothetical protein